jgi:hypothetical protein
MQNDAVFPLVVYAATTVYVTAGVLSMFSRRNLYDQIGQGDLSIVDDEQLHSDGPLERLLELAANHAEREQEIRQLLQARSNRLTRQGHAPLDIDAEVTKLERLARRWSSSSDTALIAEMRQLMIVRNERRLRQGLPALDVDVEIERALAELDRQEVHLDAASG